MSQYFSITYDMTKLNEYEKRAVFKTAQKMFTEHKAVSAGWETTTPPSLRKEPKEVIQAMLDGGWNYVPCKVSDVNEYSPLSKDLIYGVTECDPEYNFMGER